MPRVRTLCGIDSLSLQRCSSGVGMIERQKNTVLSHSRDFKAGLKTPLGAHQCNSRSSVFNKEHYCHTIVAAGVKINP